MPTEEAYSELLRRADRLRSDIEKNRKGVDVSATEAQDQVQIGRDGIKVQGRDINLFFTVAGAIAAVVTAALLWNHGVDTRDASNALVSALKEQTQALRENTCAAGYKGPESDREKFCKQVTR